MALTEAIAATTSAAVSGSIVVSDPTTLTADDLGNGEFVSVEIETLAAGWKSLRIGKPVHLSKTNNTVLITAPGTYRVRKPTTKSAVAVGYTS